MLPSSSLTLPLGIWGPRTPEMVLHIKCKPIMNMGEGKNDHVPYPS